MKNIIKKIVSKLKELFFQFGKHKNKIIFFLIGFFVAVLGFLIINIVLKNIDDPITTTITYNELETIIKNKDSAIVYYYNSKSSNEYNKSVKKYLDKNNLQYYAYNDALVEKEEYNNFLKSLNIDKEVFGLPAIIYIKNGEMYANIINIDSTDVVKSFIDNYDLYTVK